jgi:hypothetical protein
MANARRSDKIFSTADYTDDPDKRAGMESGFPYFLRSLFIHLNFVIRHS